MQGKARTSFKFQLFGDAKFLLRQKFTQYSRNKSASVYDRLVTGRLTSHLSSSPQMECCLDSQASIVRWTTSRKCGCSKWTVLHTVSLSVLVLSCCCYVLWMSSSKSKLHSTFKLFHS